MHKYRLLSLWLAALFLLTTATGAFAQVTTLENSFVKLFMNPTGAVNVTPTPPDFLNSGILFRPTLTGPQSVFKQMVAIDPFPAEAWVLDVPSGGGLLHLQNGDILSGFGNIVDAGIGNALQRTYSMEISTLPGGPAELLLTQVVSLTNTGGLEDKRARFDVSLTNLTGADITGIRYLRTINPKQGVTPDLDPGLQSVGTRNDLGTAIFPTGVAVDSTIPTLALDDPRQRHLAVASDIVNSKVNSGGNADTNIDIDALNGSYAVLTGGGPAIVGPNPFPDGTLTSPVGLNLWFDESVIGTLAAGQTVRFGTFFYVFEGPVGGGPGPGPAVPEPGALALLGGSLCSGLALLRRRRR